MYINFHKFNYKTISPSDRKRYEARDRDAYKVVIKDWVSSNLDAFVNRKWEIEEIFYLKEIGDFIKLVREAESLYELGFYTGCIALVGVSAEDFSKYLSIQNNYQTHVINTNRRGQTVDVTQYVRLRLQLDEEIITQETYNLLDEIRDIRNNCLHYNQDFKRKSDNELKDDALKSLNNLKSVLKNSIGTDIDHKDFFKLVEELCKSENHRSLEELAWKQKNMMSHLLNFSTAQDPDVKQVIKTNFYRVTDIDEDEIELTELEINPELGTKPLVWVDIDKTGEKLLEENSIVKNDVVIAEVYSDVAPNGQTQLWYLRKIDKIILPASLE